MQMPDGPTLLLQLHAKPMINGHNSPSSATAATQKYRFTELVVVPIPILQEEVSTNTHLDMTAFSRVAAGAFAREATNVVDALTTVDARIRFALVVLEVAQLTGKSCKQIQRKYSMMRWLVRVYLRGREVKHRGFSAVDSVLKFLGKYHQT